MVVEAMIGCGAGQPRRPRPTPRASSSSTSGTPSKITRGATRAPRPPRCLGTIAIARDEGVDSCAASNRPMRARLVQRPRISARGLGRRAWQTPPLRARLEIHDVDVRDRHRRTPRQCRVPCGRRRGKAIQRGCSSESPRTQKGLQCGAGRGRRGRGSSERAAASPHEVLAADGAADRQGTPAASGVCTPASPPTEARGTTGRCADPPACSGARSSTMRSRQSPESVSLSCEPRPYIQFSPSLRIVVGEREMRRAIAERLAHRDAFGIERVGRRGGSPAACLPCGCPSVSKCSSGPAFMVISGGWMIGPAFISAPESASPQGSIALGKRLVDRPRAHGPCAVSGNTPVGSRAPLHGDARPHSGPCLRASHGRVPVSAKAAFAVLPACAHGLWRRSARPKVPGGR